MGHESIIDSVMTLRGGGSDTATEGWFAFDYTVLHVWEGEVRNPPYPRVLIQSAPKSMSGALLNGLRSPATPPVLKNSTVGFVELILSS